MPTRAIRRRHRAAPQPGNADDFDVDGAVVGRIFKANAAPVESPWLWTLAFGHQEDRTPTHGYAESRFFSARLRPSTPFQGSHANAPLGGSLEVPTERTTLLLFDSTWRPVRLRAL
jgi:hypothetical protein